MLIIKVIDKLLSRYSLFCADGTLNPFHSLTHSLLINFSTSPESDVNTLFSWLHSVLDLSRGSGV